MSTSRNQWVYNFICIDQCPICPQYRLTIPFGKFPQSLPEPLSRSGTQITWSRTPESDFYFKIPGSERLVTHSWQLIHLEKAVGMREYSDFPIEYFAH
jgi:hypothetical protein